MLPKITIITPSYNQGQYLEQTILSILNQGYANLEYIIIDGGSTDNSVDIIKKYQDKISYWISERDDGQSDAIRKGLLVATGAIFNWINSDDFLEPGALHSIAHEFLTKPQKMIICGYTRCFFEEDGTESHTYRMGIRKTVVETLLQVEMNQPGSFYKMEVIKNCGGINPTLHYVFDGELWFKFLCKYGLSVVGFSDKLIANFRLHKSSKTVGHGYFEFYKEFLNIHLFLAKAIELPEPIIKYLKEDQLIDRYNSSIWDLSFLEKNKFYRVFLNKYKFLLYKDKEYNLARHGLTMALLKRQISPSHFFLFLKLCLPNFLINTIRSKKKILC